MTLRTMSTLTALLRRSLPRLTLAQPAAPMSSGQHLPDDLEDELNRPATPWYVPTHRTSCVTTNTR